MKQKIYKKIFAILAVIFIFGTTIGAGSVNNLNSKNKQYQNSIITQKNVFTEINDDYKNSEEGLSTNYWALIFAVGIYKNHPNQNRPSMLEAADDLYDVLLSSPQWQADHIHKVKGSDCTLARLISELIWLIKNVESEDMVIVYITTHGNRLKDSFGNYLDIPPLDEADGTDESLVMYEGFDCGYEFIWDDLLNSFLNMMNVQGLCLIVDSCYSGGFNDNNAKSYNSATESYETQVKEKFNNRDTNIKSLFNDLIIKLYQKMLINNKNIIKNFYTVMKEKDTFLKIDKSNNKEVDLFKQGFIEDMRGGKRIILMSSEEDKVSYGSDFSNYLIDGFWGMGDFFGNHDGINSAEESFNYADFWVNLLGRQNPTYVDNFPGEFEVTNN